MYLIQRYSVQTHPIPRQMDSISRFLDGDYMGSSEFEWGTVPRAWKYLRNNSKNNILKEIITEVDVRGVSTPISIWVIADESMIESVAIDLKEKVLNRDYNGFKENPRLIERFFAEEGGILDRSFYEKTIAWLVVDSTRDSYSEVVKEKSPVFFCLDSSLAVRTFMELRRNLEVKKEFRLFDEVYSYIRSDPGTVAGILEDDTIVFKFQGKKTRLHPNDVYHREDIPKLLFN